MSRYKIAIVALLLSAITACSGSSDAEFGDTKATTTTTTVEQLEQAYIDALGVSFGPLANGDDTIAKSLNARCLSVSWLDTVSLEALRRAKIEPSDLTTGDLIDTLAVLDLDDTQVTSMLDAFASCNSNLRTAYLASISAETDLDEAAFACLRNSIDDALLREAFATSLKEGTEDLDDTEAGKDLTAAVLQCLSPAG